MEGGLRSFLTNQAVRTTPLTGDELSAVLADLETTIGPNTARTLVVSRWTYDTIRFYDRWGWVFCWARRLLMWMPVWLYAAAIAKGVR